MDEENHAEQPAQDCSQSHDNYYPPVRGSVYQIRVKGQLDSSWSEWFDGLAITVERDGVTLLAGPVTDQPALHGLLIKIRDLGLSLLSVNRVETGDDC